MGLITGILTLPLAPVRGVGWVVDKVRLAAEQELDDPAALQEELASLERARSEGRISEEEFGQREEELLAQLMAGRQ
ncbi:gas vesicle protein GvpG [Streptomyces palmae]|uniref:Gas vesicle synthesis protein n=1 Tax=Streptomyces palmae TaxID=1701085 RepID=A0A4Z0HJQ6_9ACTN|nr:gas vesicle protein GvpG [Streptomyces palmae]TGB19379.1 gas vesicle synthesis protein [Streptomyces palmae]